MATDSKPNCACVWYKNPIQNFRDFNIFLMWIDGEKGFSVEKVLDWQK